MHIRPVTHEKKRKVNITERRQNDTWMTLNGDWMVTEMYLPFSRLNYDRKGAFQFSRNCSVSSCVHAKYGIFTKVKSMRSRLFNFLEKLIFQNSMFSRTCIAYKFQTVYCGIVLRFTFKIRFANMLYDYVQMRLISTYLCHYAT